MRRKVSIPVVLVIEAGEEEESLRKGMHGFRTRVKNREVQDEEVWREVGNKVRSDGRFELEPHE